MKFEKLEIMNLASLDRTEGETIDFKEGSLASSSIFSIVGPTGSGKSTLLDAICLALYGRAPRYPRKNGEKARIKIYGGDNNQEKNRLAPTDCRNILTDGKKVGYSKLTFVANNGTTYRAEWHVKFKTKHYDDPEVHLYNLTKNGAEENWKDLPNIIGLDYEQFLRTVLIAQGTFSNFLKANDEDRFELLEKLVGNGELYKNIVNGIMASHKDAKDKCTEYDIKTSRYNDDKLDDETLQKLKEEIEQLNTQEEAAKKELEEIATKLKWFDDDEEQKENIDKYTTIYNKAKEAQEVEKEAFGRLALHDATTDGMKRFLTAKGNEQNINTHTTTINNLEEKDIKVNTKKIETEKEELETLKTAAKKAEDKLSDAKPHIKEAKELKATITAHTETLNGKNETKDRSRREYFAAKKELNENIDDNESIKNELANAEKAKEEAAEAYTTRRADKNAVDAAMLQDTLRKTTQKNTDLANAIRIQGDISKNMNTIKENRDKTAELQMTNKTIDEIIKELHIEELKKEVETLNNTFTLMTSEEWGLHRKSLTDGNPCPLCGAVHHPYADDSEYTPVMNDLREQLENKRTLLNNKENELSILNQKATTNTSEINMLARNNEKLEQTNATLKNQWSPIHEKYPDWPEDSGELAKLQETTIQEWNSAQTAVNNHNTLIGEVETLLKKKEKAEKAAAYKTAQEEYDMAVEEIKNWENQIKNKIGENDPDKYEKQLEDNKNNTADAVNKKKEKIDELEKELAILKGKLDQAKELKKQEEEYLEKNNKQLDEWIADYNNDHENRLTRADLATISTWNDEWETVRKKQSRLASDATSAKTTLDNEKKKNQDHQVHKPEQEKTALEARKQELDGRTTDHLVDKKLKLEKHNKAVEGLGNMANEVETAKRRYNILDKIKGAIGGEGKTLRKIAQCYTMPFLVEHANAEIRKFNKRYELQHVKNSLAIRIIDHDRGDNVRDITSLSGGETFIVSLGLALGLSSLSSRSIAIENLFIDEGFGTLDADTLSEVIDSLAMLQSAQGKKVGVISHTDTMSERITTQIRVIKNGASGSSRIEIVP